MSARRILRKNEHGEQGAVLALAAVGIVVAILAAAMAIDVGSVIWRKRDLQVVADLAATDTAQQLATLVGGPTQAVAEQFAQESADRNGFDVTVAGYMPLVVALGTFDSTRSPAFVALPPPDVALAEAVQVTASREVAYHFFPGSNTVTTEAVASFGDEPRAAFSIGSKLASLNAESSSVLGPVLTGLLGVNPSLNAGVVTYEGLASSTVTLEDLALELGFATVDDLLAGDVSVPGLAEASAQILDRNGTADASVVTALFDIAADSTLTNTVAFGDLVDVEQGQGDAAASMGLNVLDLLTSAGQRVRIADGTNLLNIPLNVGIDGLFSSQLRLKLIEAPVISAFGPVGTQAKTAQIETTLATTIRVTTDPICVLILCIGLGSLGVEVLEVELPIFLGAAGATGTIAAIDCSLSPPETPVDISVVTDGVTASAAAKARLLGIAGLSVAKAELPIASGTTVPSLRFPKSPGDPMPMVFPSAIQTTDGTSTLATGLVQDAQLTVVGLDAAGVLALLEPVTTQIDDLILNPLLDALGLSVGGADVRTLAVDCPGSGGQLVR